MKKFNKFIMAGAGLCAALSIAGAATAEPRINDFPTRARVEFVLACMSDVEKNQQNSFEYLTRCSCAVDTIAKYMTYEQFERAHTLRSLIQSKKQNTEVFQSPDISKKPLDRYYHAQAMAEIKCF